MQFYVGCSGWSYTACKGPFYPSQLENSKWLQFYSGAFDYVEIDSSFYRIPNDFTVKNWHKKTPDNFKFTAKFPKVITHDKKLKNVEKDLEYFLKVMGAISDKGLALLLQLPRH
jgi:uncharacterized protein YecE (DUF72 family)